MSWPFYLLYGFFGAVLQGSLLAEVIPTAGHPDLLLMLVVHLALHEPVMRGSLLCSALGLIRDSLSGHYLGLYALVYVLVFLILKSFVRRLNTENTFLLMTLVGTGCLLQAGFLFLMTSLFSPARFGLFPLEPILWQLAWSVLVAHFLGILFYKIQSRWGPRRWLVPSHRLEQRDED